MSGAQTTESSLDRIRATFERNAKALALRPGVGQGTAVTRVRLREGLACEIEEGPWKFYVDMSAKSGGNNSAPNPGIFGRAALGSCLAIGYMQWAAKLGVPISELEVEIQAVFDSRGMYGVDGHKPGYREIRYVVHVASDAPQHEILHVLNEADAHSDYLHVFRNPQRVLRQVHLRAGGDL
jgi:uncharacterized OsmC-like protein